MQHIFVRKVRSYNPRTSFGEHQFFVYISAGDAATVHVPVVATRLGDIHVRLHAATLMGQHHYVKKINVQVPYCIFSILKITKISAGEILNCN